jgi:glycosyltransferase involved in cell wall biosynthesis
MTGNRPEVSIVLPCYNYGRYLPECLASIRSQEGNIDYEVIAINDGSADDSADILDLIDDPRFRVIHHRENHGHVATVNEAVALTRGNFIARIDADDRYRPHFLRVTVERLRALPDTAFVYGRVAHIDETGKVTFNGNEGGERAGAPNLFLDLLQENFVCVPGLMARGDIWRSLAPVPLNMVIDDWYYTLLASRDHQAQFIDAVLADYRVHGHNHHGRAILDRSYESSLFWMLDRVYTEMESDAELEKAKRGRSRRVYGGHYLALADRYFGCHMAADARRCYKQAIRWRPVLALRIGVLRRLIATWLGFDRYERAKWLVRAWAR